MKYLTLSLFFTFFLSCLAIAQENPQLDATGLSPVIDKSGDPQLKALLGEVVPKFRQLKFKGGNLEINYNLFTPQTLQQGKKYPLVVFMGDASTVGENVRAPLTQGYGALLFAAADSQRKNPCYVLVPQFSGVAVNDEYKHTREVDELINLVKHVIQANPIDSNRVYITGQSMGGMVAMYLNNARPKFFAASLYVDCHWDTQAMDNLLQRPFIFIYAGEKGKAWPMKDAIETAARKLGKSYTWSEWSAKLPQSTQDNLAATMLGKGQPINIIGFENNTVLPASGKGSEHMYSFDYAYKLTPVRNWLFKQTLLEAN